LSAREGWKILKSLNLRLIKLASETKLRNLMI